MIKRKISLDWLSWSEWSNSLPFVWLCWWWPMWFNHHTQEMIKRHGRDWISSRVFNEPFLVILNKRFCVGGRSVDNHHHLPVQIEIENDSSTGLQRCDVLQPRDLIMDSGGVNRLFRLSAFPSPPLKWPFNRLLYNRTNRCVIAFNCLLMGYTSSFLLSCPLAKLIGKEVLLVQMKVHKKEYIYSRHDGEWWLLLLLTYRTDPYSTYSLLTLPIWPQRMTTRWEGGYEIDG